jgi:hypothetical protein
MKKIINNKKVNDFCQENNLSINQFNADTIVTIKHFRFITGACELGTKCLWLRKF